MVPTSVALVFDNDSNFLNWGSFNIITMGLENLILLLVLSIIFMPVILIIGCLVLVMTCNWSRNFRSGYVKLLLKLFQVCLVHSICVFIMLIIFLLTSMALVG